MAPLTVAWISHFPVEWLPDAPENVRRLPREHPSSWQRVLLDELEKIPELRLHIIVLRKQFERDSTFERNGVTFHLIKTPGGFRAPSLFWVDTILIRRVLKRIKPDVIHAWGTERGAALVANRLGLPRVVTVQGLVSWYNQIVPPHWHDRLAGVLERHSLPRAPLITTESNFSVRWLRKQFPSVKVEQIEHAPDPIFHRVQRQPQIKPFRFIFVGTLDERKGGKFLIQALDQLRKEISFEFIVVGKPKPAMIESLRNYVATELWSQIIFKGNLTALQVADELNTVTMMIFPTLADVSPNAVKEAIVAGVPVVGSAVGGIPDYVIPGRNGILFRSGELKELIEAIRAACRHPLFSCGMVEPDVLAQMRDYLSPVLMGKRFLEMYQAAYRHGHED
jgi:glycosyltransferase involved in cell wall biosynthesis